MTCQDEPLWRIVATQLSLRAVSGGSHSDCFHGGGNTNTQLQSHLNVISFQQDGLHEICTLVEVIPDLSSSLTAEHFLAANWFDISLSLELRGAWNILMPYKFKIGIFVLLLPQ